MTRAVIPAVHAFAMRQSPRRVGGGEQEGGEEEVAVGAAAAPPTPLQSILAVWCYIWYAATLVPCDAALLMPPLLIPPRSDDVRLEARPSNALYCACNRWAASMSLLSHCSADLALSCTTVVIYVYCIRIAMTSHASIRPELECYAALLSPSTGIVDSHSYMLALQGDAEEHGAVVALESPVVGGSILPSGEILLEVGGEAPMELQCKHVINSAGLSAPWIARTILSDNGAGPAEMNAEAGNGGGGGGSGSGVTGMLDDAASALDIPGAYFAKGNYYALGCKAPFSRLVYPVPQQAGLGVHGTIDLGGAMRFGPDVEWIGCGTNSTLSNCDLDYTVDPARADSFYAEVRKYWPALPDDSLLPDYAGVRPKINAEGEAAADFVVWAGKDHTTFTTRDGCEMDLSGMVNLFGIESPGLTSSLAIADAAVGALDLPKDLAI